MNILSGFEDHAAALVDLFTATFTASEGAEEGARIGGLVRDLLARTPECDIDVFRVEESGRLVGAAVFTRMVYPDDPRHVVLLSPMAVLPARQGQGIGQALIAGALGSLRRAGAKVAFTYGDPAFYGRVGFVPVTETQARAPLPLRQPEGWIGQSLVDDTMPTLAGRPTCAAALDNADFW